MEKGEDTVADDNQEEDVSDGVPALPPLRLSTMFPLTKMEKTPLKVLWG